VRRFSEKAAKIRFCSIVLALILCLAADLSPSIFRALTAAVGSLHVRVVAAESERRGATDEDEPDPAAVALGERLFLETRFAQLFFENSNGDANAVLERGDPTLDITLTPSGTFYGPFIGGTMNCRSCHLVDEHQDTDGGGMRAYADFARRSPIPPRGDGRVVTPRNSQPLVNAFLNAKSGNFLLHFDGEFTTVEELIRATLIGRNFGWLPSEEARAVAHIAHIIRKDDGKAELAEQFGGAYRVLLKGTDPEIPSGLRLPKRFLLDVDHATDNRIVDNIAALMTEYLRQLIFQRDRRGFFSGSPYDEFLRINRLPRAPDPGESDVEYSRRLAQLIDGLKRPRFVSGSFKFHDQPFLFGALELEGLKIFLREPAQLPLTPFTITRGAIGNCVACHPAPKFTDFGFHNTGAAQDEYDAVHGAGAFNNIPIPDFSVRRSNYDAFLPPTAAHPNASGRFIDVPAKNKPGRTDLGIWNVFANPAMPRPQERIRRIYCAQFKSYDCSNAALLPLTIASFKTPGLRDLGHSAPYLHTGRANDLEAVINFYAKFSALARAGTMRNADPQLRGIALKAADTAALAGFLKSLNEDYN
jgi:hypothetical protein